MTLAEMAIQRLGEKITVKISRTYNMNAIEILKIVGDDYTGIDYILKKSGELSIPFPWIYVDQLDLDGLIEKKDPWSYYRRTNIGRKLLEEVGNRKTLIDLT